MIRKFPRNFYYRKFLRNSLLVCLFSVVVVTAQKKPEIIFIGTFRALGKRKVVQNHRPEDNRNTSVSLQVPHDCLQTGKKYVAKTRTNSPFCKGTTGWCSDRRKKLLFIFILHNHNQYQQQCHLLRLEKN